MAQLSPQQDEAAMEDEGDAGEQQRSHAQRLVRACPNLLIWARAFALLIRLPSPVRERQLAALAERHLLADGTCERPHVLGPRVALELLGARGLAGGLQPLPRRTLEVR